MCIIERNCEIIGETKIPADVSLIIKFIENAKKSVDSDDVLSRQKAMKQDALVILFTGS